MTALFVSIDLLSLYPDIPVRPICRPDEVIGLFILTGQSSEGKSEFLTSCALGNKSSFSEDSDAEHSFSEKGNCAKEQPTQERFLHEQYFRGPWKFAQQF
jgi:hypothetical protein